ncbi:hypothetical protein NL676_000796 [Syzygium grande]|nr:hypothetical protein NL676_000796 [Syzygium grande]
MVAPISSGNYLDELEDCNYLRTGTINVRNPTALVFSIPTIIIDFASTTPSETRDRDELDEQSVGRGGKRRRRGGPQGPGILPLELHPPLHPPASQKPGQVLVFSGQQQQEEAISSVVVGGGGGGDFEEASGRSRGEEDGGVDAEGPALEHLVSVLRLFSE